MLSFQTNPSTSWKGKHKDIEHWEQRSLGIILEAGFSIQDRRRKINIGDKIHDNGFASIVFKWNTVGSQPIWDGFVPKVKREPNSNFSHLKLAKYLNTVNLCI